MAEHFISKNSKPTLRVNNMCVLARAVRNNSKIDLRQVISTNEASNLQISGQNNLRFQIHEAIRNAQDFPTPLQQSRSRLPLRMIASKPATRRHLPENPVNSTDKFDSATIRKQILAPPWREKEAHRKRLQSAYLHNRRKIEEIQRMKIKLKCPRYDPNELLTPYRQQFATESQLIPITEDSREKENLPPYNGSQRLCRRKSLMTDSEDQLEDVSGDNTSYEQILREKDNFVFNPTPSVRPANKPFVWNPVTFPNKQSFPSAIELLESNYSPQFELNNRREYFNSPGNCTTSSTSSGLTVAEETLQLTYYAERCEAPLDNQSHSRRFRNFSFSSDPVRNADSRWVPHSHQANFVNYFEE